MPDSPRTSAACIQFCASPENPRARKSTCLGCGRIITRVFRAWVHAGGRLYCEGDDRG